MLQDDVPLRVCNLTYCYYQELDHFHDERYMDPWEVLCQ